MSGLRVGIVGAGHISSSHISGWKKARGAVVTSITDLDRSAAKDRAKQWGVQAVADDIEHLLDTCDVVDICTPPHTHSSIIIAAAGAGRHVLVEKPVVTSVEDWRRVRHEVETRGVQLAVVHNIKFSRSLQTTRRWIDEGRIGRILRIRREFLTHPAKDRMLAGDGHWSHTLPGGRWFETLPHELYLIYWLAGALEFDGLSALATGNSPPGAPADEVSLSFRGSDVLATVQYSAHCELNRRVFEVIGTRGRIHVDLLSDSASLSRSRDQRWRRVLGGARIDALQCLVGWIPDRLAYLADRIRSRTPHSRLISSFADSLLKGTPTPTPLDEIGYVVEMGDTVSRAIEAQVTTP